jgi:hypothetical protein
VFIRAPRFGRLGPGVETIARRGEETVGVRSRRIVALAFHPELTEDARLHRWFLREVVGGRAAEAAAGTADATSAAAAHARPRTEAR